MHAIRNDTKHAPHGVLFRIQNSVRAYPDGSVGGEFRQVLWDTNL
jgi:hypothetical protein